MPWSSTISKAAVLQTVRLTIQCLSFILHWDIQLCTRECPVQHKYITWAFTGNTTGCRQRPGEFREAEYSPHMGSVQSNSQCQDLPPKVPDANTRQPLLLTCRDSCHTTLPTARESYKHSFLFCTTKGEGKYSLAKHKDGQPINMSDVAMGEVSRDKCIFCCQFSYETAIPHPNSRFPIKNASNNAVPISGRIRLHPRQLASRPPVTTLPSW